MVAYFTESQMGNKLYPSLLSMWVRFWTFFQKTKRHNLCESNWKLIAEGMFVKTVLSVF